MRRRDFSKVFAAGAVGAGGILVSHAAAAQTMPAPVFFPKTRMESDAGVPVVNYSFPPGCVDRYGTNSTPGGKTDMAPAFNRAFRVAAQGGCEVTFGATAPYLLAAPINCTGLRGVVCRDVSAANASASAGPSIVIGHTGHGFDLATSTELVFLDMKAKNVPMVVPQSLFFMARNPMGSGAGLHRFVRIGTTSDCTFQQISYAYGSEENTWTDCLLQNRQPGSSIHSINATNPANYRSTFVPIAVGSQSNAVHTHRGGEYFNFGAGGAQNEVVFQLEAAGNFTCTDGLLFCSKGRAYIDITGAQAMNSFCLENMRGEVNDATQPPPQFGIAARTTGTTGNNSFINWKISNCSFQCAQAGVYFGNEAQIQRLTIDACTSASNGRLLSAKFMSFCDIAHTQQLCEFRAGGTIQGCRFFGLLSALLFGGANVANGGLDAGTGQHWPAPAAA